MAGLIDGARRVLGRSTDLGARIEGLQDACDAARGRLDDGVVTDAAAVADRAAERLRLSAQHTVVAIAGATGSGKSSTFNALTGLELSAVGVKRPTTSWATACVWGGEGDTADELLEWLGIPPRHRTMRDSMLDSHSADADLNGVVLLDLPDHDSTEVSHHLEVDRLVELADLLVWVLDPQKYADAALHDRYLAPMAANAPVIMVVLNHIDTVVESERDRMVGDVKRLLAADGLGDVPVLAISAKHGDGVSRLRGEIVSRVAAKRATTARLGGDILTQARALSEAGGLADVPEISERRRAEVADTCADAAGVPVVVDAVGRSVALRTKRATGWPVTSWVSRLRRDPLKRLHLPLATSGGKDDSDAIRELAFTARTSTPEATPVQRARVDTAVRGLADDASSGLSRPWASAVRRSSVSRIDDVTDGLDRAVGEADLDLVGVPGWAKAVRALQWVLITAALVGLGWLAGLAFLGYLGLPEPASSDVEIGSTNVPLPTLLLLGGVLGGLLLAWICRLGVRATARRRSGLARRRLREGVDSVVDELVIQPVTAELDGYRRYREGVQRALSG